MDLKELLIEYADTTTKINERQVLEMQIKSSLKGMTDIDKRLEELVELTTSLAKKYDKAKD